MLINFVLLALLFIVGLITTFLNFPIKKFTSWFQSFFLNTHSHVTIAPKKVKSSTHNKAELRSVFSSFDMNKDGYITKQELRESVKNIGISITEREVVKMVEKVDFNGDGLVDFDEFGELFDSMVSREEANEEEGDGGEELKEAFDVFDGDRDGLITVEELGLVLCSLGFKEGKKFEDCKEMIRKFDMDGDGTVNFEEFKRMMKAGRSLVSVS